MTPPVQPISGATDPEFGDIELWRQAARNAQAALRTNANDAEAREQLEDAQFVLRRHAASVGARMNLANEMERQNIREQIGAERAGPAQAYAANVLHGASLGLGDELAAIGAVLPGGLSPGQAQARYQAGREELYAAQPVASFLGDMTGAVGLGVASAGAFPGLAARIAAGGTLAGSGARTGAMLAGGTIGGGEGVLRGLAGEGTLGERGRSALGQGAVGFGLGVGGVGATNVVRRLRARSIAKDIELGNRAAASRFAPAQAEESARFHAARARQAEVQTQIAEETAPARIVSAQNQAQLSTIRVGEVGQRAAQTEARTAVAQARRTDIPLDRTMKEDRAFLLALRRAEAEARRAGSTTGATGVEQRFRAGLARMRMSPEDIEIAVQRARQTVGSPLYGGGAAPSTAIRPEPGITSSEVDAALVEGRAGLQAQRATPVSTAPVEAPTFVQAPSTQRGTPGAMPGADPREAARAAYGQVFAATGDEAQAAAAARHGAGFAQQAVIQPAEDASMALMRLAQSEPTDAAVSELTALVRQLPQAQRRLALNQLYAVNPAWRVRIFGQ